MSRVYTVAQAEEGLWSRSAQSLEARRQREIRSAQPLNSGIGADRCPLGLLSYGEDVRLPTHGHSGISTPQLLQSPIAAVPHREDGDHRSVQIRHMRRYCRLYHASAQEPALWLDVSVSRKVRRTQRDSNSVLHNAGCRDQTPGLICSCVQCRQNKRERDYSPHFFNPPRLARPGNRASDIAIGPF